MVLLPQAAIWLVRVAKEIISYHNENFRDIDPQIYHKS